jgi:hypothetical protein
MKIKQEVYMGDSKHDFEAKESCEHEKHESEHEEREEHEGKEHKMSSHMRKMLGM